MAEPAGEKLVDGTELLFRQVHPTWMTGGRLTELAFIPSKKDERLLSVSRSYLTTAEKAYRLHTEKRKLPSEGTWAISVDECQSADLNANADPVEDDPSHSVVDFRQLSGNQARKKRQMLAHKARERGRLYPAEDQQQSLRISE